jgi:Flp pilus assembly protein TadG
MIKPVKQLTRSKKEIAQTMVEFALVFPIVLLITYGMIEFGRMVFIIASVTGSAREGARYGAAAGDSGDGTPYYADCDGIRNAVRSTAFLITIPDSNITINYDVGSGFGSSCEILADKVANNNDPIDTGDRIKVGVNTQYEPIIGGFLGIKGFPITKENARTILANISINPYP